MARIHRQRYRNPGMACRSCSRHAPSQEVTVSAPPPSMVQYKNRQRVQALPPLLQRSRRGEEVVRERMRLQVEL